MNNEHEQGAIRVTRWDLADTKSEDDVAVEAPLEIRLFGTAQAVLMRTPGMDHELAAGFALSDGLVVNPRDIKYVSHCRQDLEHGHNIVHVALPDRLRDTFSSVVRPRIAMGGCGLCSKKTLEAIRHCAPPVSGRTPSGDMIFEAVEAMGKAQTLFSRTGGVHAAGLWHLNTRRLLAHAEDIGRHNAVDKVIGAFVLARRSFSDTLLVVTSRAGFEIVQKAAMAGIPALVAVSAPSSLAIALAEAQNMFLAGFARGGRANIYTKPKSAKS